MHSNFFSSQRGAMFGLDARIALAIFSVLAVVAGVFTGMNLSTTHAHSLAQEMDQTAQAITAIHQDLKVDLHKVLLNATDKNAYIALYDPEVLEGGKPRARWLGPYIKTATPTHPRFGEIRIIKKTASIRDDCYGSEICYLWLVYGHVPIPAAEEVNTIFDSQEVDPQLTGRIQWQGGADPKHVVLWYRASRAVSGQSY